MCRGAGTSIKSAFYAASARRQLQPISRNRRTEITTTFSNSPSRRTKSSSAKRRWPLVLWKLSVTRGGEGRSRLAPPCQEEKGKVEGQCSVQSTPQFTHG